MELPTGEDNAARLARLLSFGMSDGPTSDCADALPAEQTLSGCEIPFPSVPGYRIAGLLGEG